MADRLVASKCTEFGFRTAEGIIDAIEGIAVSYVNSDPDPNFSVGSRQPEDMLGSVSGFEFQAWPRARNLWSKVRTISVVLAPVLLTHLVRTNAGS